MEFVKKFTPPDFEDKNFAPSISTVLVGKKHKKWVKMEKFTRLPKILHCRRQWRQWQIPPLSLNTVHMDHSINADGHLEKLTLCSLLSAVIKSVFVANWFKAIVPDDVSQTSLGGKNDFHDHLRQRGDVRFSWAEQQTLMFFPGATHLPEQNSDLALNLEKTELQCHATC